MDISNWCSDIQFSINGTNSEDNFNKEDIEIIESYDVCNNCFYGLKNLFYLLKDKRLTLDEIRDYMRNRNIKSWKVKKKTKKKEVRNSSQA